MKNEDYDCAFLWSELLLVVIRAQRQGTRGQGFIVTCDECTDQRWAWGVTSLQKLDNLKVVFMRIMNFIND